VGQKRYVETIRKNTIVLGVGPAGTGKTFLAVAMAVAALRRKEISRIILTRPAVEAGEKLGYLPGDLQNKIDPYLRPLYDALYETMGPEGYARNLEKGIIEVAPLAYMRGRTLDDSFIILDEAQNTTQEQMKMFLTRLGVNSKAVVTGDLTQTDLPFGKTSGLAQAIKILDGIEDIGIHHFTGRDVVRHRLVQKIIEAYEKQGKENAERPAERRIYRKREQ
jgi:phosphate starvation-inducible PhoH-like protein